MPRRIYRKLQAATSASSSNYQLSLESQNSKSSLQSLSSFQTPTKKPQKVLQAFKPIGSIKKKNQWSNNRPRKYQIKPRTVKKLPPAQRNPPNSLQLEISRFSSYTINKIQSRSKDVKNFINSFKQTLKEIGLNFEVTLFGSYPTGLALANSDLDLLLTNSSLDSPISLQLVCSSLADTLIYLPWVSWIKPIPTARIPVIKLQIEMSHFNPTVQVKVDVDISFDSSVMNEKNGIATMQMTKELLNSHRHMKALVLIVKQILASNKLNSVYLGGLSSYGVSIWVCAYLKRHCFERVDKLLLGFLDFFGHQFDPSRTGVCIHDGFFALEFSMAHSVTRDPMDFSLNVTRTAYNISQVLKVFARSFEVLKEKNKLREIFKPLIN